MNSCAGPTAQGHQGLQAFPELVGVTSAKPTSIAAVVAVRTACGDRTLAAPGRA